MPPFHVINAFNACTHLFCGNRAQHNGVANTRLPEYKHTELIIGYDPGIVYRFGIEIIASGTYHNPTSPTCTGALSTGKRWKGREEIHMFHETHNTVLKVQFSSDFATRFHKVSSLG